MDEIIPIFRSSDAASAARWYERLGFEVQGEHRFAPTLPLYLFLRRDVARIHLSEHKGDAKPGGLAYFYVDNLDEVGAEFGVTPDNQPWGREIQLTDPDGNRLRIGERRD